MTEASRVRRRRLVRGLLALWSIAAACPASGGAVAPCAGDCNGDASVSISELIVGVNIANGAAPLASCAALDGDGDGAVSVSELVLAVNNLLGGCGHASATATPTPSGTATAPAVDTATLTPSRSPTRTKKPTKTATPTPTDAPSVCGGNIQSLPVVCNLTIVPNPVSRAGTIAFRFGVSDLDGDINGICIELTYPGLEPQTSCSGLTPTHRVINLIETTTPISASPLQFGTYGAAVQVFDAAGHQSNVSTATFVVQ